VLTGDWSKPRKTKLRRLIDKIYCSKRARKLFDVFVKVCTKNGWAVGQKRRRVILKIFKDSLSTSTSQDETDEASCPLPKLPAPGAKPPLNPQQARAEELTKLIRAVKRDNPDFGVQRVYFS